MTGLDDPLGWVGSAIDGRFEVKEVIGEGGFGVVYRGRHLSLDEPVAIKCLKVPATMGEAERASFLDRFRSEAKILHRLSRKSTAIVQALDFGAAASPRGPWTPYIVMEWIEGRSLENDIVARMNDDSTRRPIHEATTLLEPVAEALAVAHAEGVAHLDVKPGNVLLGSDGAVKLLDFGIAKILESSESFTRAMTRGEGSAFTPMYAAPEQFNRRHGRPGPWTDVFALALVLVELCSGEPALSGDTPLQLYVAAANEQLRPSLAASGVRVGQHVEDVVRRALEVDPQERYRSAGDMWSALREALATPSLLSATAMAVQSVRVSVAGSSHAAHAETSVSARTQMATTGVATGLNRVCTILMAELAGMDGASEHLDPSDVAELVDSCMRRLDVIVRSLGGSVERIVGDSLMAVFGLYGESASAAERAVHASLRMQLAPLQAGLPRSLVERLGLGVRVGVSTGRVFVTAAQATGGFKLAATGAPVKLASEMQRHASPNEPLIDRDTHRQVAGMFRVGEPREILGRGAAYPVEALATDRRSLLVEAARDFHGLPTRLIGRATERRPPTLNASPEGMRRFG